MSQAESLKKLEALLESFLQSVIELKGDRLHVLGGLNRLDDITRRFEDGENLVDEVGNWFAESNRWLHDDKIRPADELRISHMLGQIQRELHASQDDSPATMKIMAEIERWVKTARPGMDKLTLRRGPEIAESQESGDTIAPFTHTLERIVNLFADMSAKKEHLLTVLDEALSTAKLQGNREALLLSAAIIYYLRQGDYKLEPYVERLKEAEVLQKGRPTHA